MNKSIFFILITLFLISCGNKTGEQETEKQAEEQIVPPVDSLSVNIYYFHGKQRCKTCIAVSDLAKRIIKEVYADNSKVKFIEIDTSDKQYKSLVNKYQVSWNALIIVKGEDSVDITEQAFANAISNPTALSALIKKEINQRIS